MQSCGAGCQVEYGTRENALDQSADGTTKAYVQHYPGNNYISSIFHHVKLEGLEPSTTYYYRRAHPHVQRSPLWLLAPATQRRSTGKEPCSAA